MKRIFLCVNLIILGTAFGMAQQNPMLRGSVRVGESGNVDWTQFNFDPAHDGYNPYETILSPANVGNVILKWSYTPPNGAFEGSPAVSGGIVYFGVENTTLHDYYAVFALNANTGALIWNYATVGPPYGSPAVAFGWVYVVGGDVYSLDANTGSLHWQWQSPNHDCKYSPTLVNDILYVACDPDTVYALNAATGTVVWQYQLFSGINPSLAAANNVVYVTTQDGGVYALHGSTGTLIWSRQLGLSPTPQPTIYTTYGGLSTADGVVYIEAANPATRAPHPYNVWALDANTGATVWKSPSIGMLDPILGTTNIPAIANGMVYAGADTWLYAFNGNTGKTLWQYQLPYNGVAYSPIVANGVVYAPIEQCCSFETGTYTLAAVDANTGVGLWSTMGIFSTFDNYPTAAVVNGMIYTSVPSPGYGFVAFGLPSGQRSEKLRTVGAH